MHPDTDVAVFTADQDTPDIPIAPVLERPIYLSDPIILTGYGCEARDGFGDNHAGNRLRFGEGFMADNELLADYPIGTSRSKSIFTASTLRDAGMVGLCPGDSGGALFHRLEDGKLAVVGVNAAISTGVNIISRVDSSSETDVFTWLQGLGVEVVVQEGKTPFMGDPLAIPGTLEAEHFDVGRPDVAYHDTDGINAPKGWYRPEPVDLDPVTGAPGNFNIGGIAAGEWLEYTISVATGGIFELDVIGSSWQANEFHIEVDGINVTGSVSVAETGGLQNFQSNVLQPVGIDAGEHSLRIAFDYGGWNFDAMTFTQLPPSCTDGYANGTETDVDCGGDCTTGCDNGQSCAMDADCLVPSCIAGTCALPSCTDGLQNGAETGVDCGGTCSPCLPDNACQVPTDCPTGPTCENGQKDGDEADIDCGGSCGQKCLDGAACFSEADCAGGSCVNSVCSLPVETGDSPSNGSTTDAGGCSLVGGRPNRPGSTPGALVLLLLSGLGLFRMRRAGYPARV
jgi:hypothetical protein